jgi:hypothetical protein
VSSFYVSHFDYLFVYHGYYSNSKHFQARAVSSLQQKAYCDPPMHQNPDALPDDAQAEFEDSTHTGGSSVLH